MRLLNLDVRYFSLPISLFIQLEYFLLYHTTKFFAALTKRVADYFYHKDAAESQLIG